MKHLETVGKLRDDQLEKLKAFEKSFTELTDTLKSLALPTIEDYRTPEKRPHAQHNTR